MGPMGGQRGSTGASGSADDHGAAPHDCGPAEMHAHGRDVHAHREDEDEAGHGGHDHRPSPDADRKLLGAALALLLAFMAGEVVVGLLSGSLALLTDAGHMLTDAASIALALVAMRLAARPPGGRLTFGLQRVEILSAQANGLTLLVLVVVFTVEGVRRLVHPPEVQGLPVLLTALAGMAVNVAAVMLLRRADRRSLNVEGAFQHVLTDLYAFVATAVAGAIVLTTGFNRADALAALVVAALMLRSGLGLVRASWRVFLEASPAGTDPDEVGAALGAVDDVVEVHDLHVWEVTSGFAAMSAHVLVRPDRDCHAVRVQLEQVLAGRFGLHHTTLQVDHAEPDLLQIGGRP